MKIFNNFGIKSKNIGLMYLNSIFAGMLFFIPILALYFQENLFTLTNVALIFSIQAIGFVVFQYPTGAIADIIGRKKTLVAAVVINILGVIFLAFGHSMLMFIFYAIISSLGNSLFSGADSALIWDTLKQEKKEKYYKKIIGTKYALWPVGAAAGSVVGGYLAAYSLSYPIFLSFFPMTIALIAVALMKEPKYKKGCHKNIAKHMWKSSGVIIKNYQLVILLLSALIFVGIGDSVHSFKPIFYQFLNIPIIYFGYIFGIGFALSSLGHYFSHDVAKVMGDKKAIIFACFMLTLSIFLSSFANLWLAVGILLLGQIFYGIGRPVTEHLINLETQSSIRATILSGYNLMRFIGVAMFTPLLGYFAQIYNISIGFRIGAAIMFIIPILFLFLRKNKPTSL